MNIYIIDHNNYKVSDNIRSVANVYYDATSINYLGKYEDLMGYWINFYPSGYVVSPNKMIENAIQVQ